MNTHDLHCVRYSSPDVARFSGSARQPDRPLSQEEIDRLLARTPLGRGTLRDRAERQRQAGADQRVIDPDTRKNLARTHFGRGTLAEAGYPTDGR